MIDQVEEADVLGSLSYVLGHSYTIFNFIAPYPRRIDNWNFLQACRDV